MFRNILKTFYRNLFKDKLSFLITVFGFVAGICSALLLFCYVYYEYNYESVHEKRKQIYRVELTTITDGKPMEFAPAVSPLGPYLKSAIPEIENFSRVNVLFSRGVFRTGDKPNVSAGNVLLVDSSFFDLFTFSFKEGGAEALRSPGQVVITASLARSLFGNEDCLGKLVIFNISRPLKVGAVVKDPVNTHLKFQALISWMTMPDEEVWDDAHSYTYLLLNKNADPGIIRKKISEVTAGSQVLAAAQKKLNAKFEFPLTPLTDIHLYSHRHNELSENNSADLLYILLSIAIFLVLISCFNYINIAVSTSMTRSKEIAVRKVFGAAGSQIAGQFFVETFVIVLFSFIVSIIAVVLLLDRFSALMEQQFDWALLFNKRFILTIGGMVLFVALLSGSYPSFYLSLLNPTSIFNTKVAKISGGHLSIRKVLIVLQLIISTGVIACTGIAISQLKYITELDIGFDKERIVYFDIPYPDRISYLKDELRKSPSIEAVALGDYSPLYPHSDEYTVEQKDGSMGVFNLQRMSFGYSFVDMMKMKIVKGRNFDQEFRTDDSSAFIVNEAAIKLFGWDNPIGKNISAINYKKKGAVVGVMKDATLFSLHRKGEPLVIELATDENYNNTAFFVKYNTDKIDKLITTLKEGYRKAFGDIPFEYKFLDDEYDKLYKTDQRYKKIISYGSIIMILISSLGLYGLSTFIASKSRNESGVRKVLGASVFQIATLHIKNFFMLSVIGSLIALPIVYYFSWKWLQTFSMRISINFWMLLGSCLLTMIIVVFTTGFNALKLGRLNPASVLREK